MAAYPCQEDRVDVLDAGYPINTYGSLTGIEELKSAIHRMHNYNHTVA